jgi:hypothetical protein
MTSTPEEEQQGPEVDADLETSLAKDTLEDLDADEEAGEVRGGRQAGKCTYQETGCTDAGE